MRSLVTGASGFLGTHLTRELVKRGHRVTVLLRAGSRTGFLDGIEGSVRVVRGDLDDLRELSRALKDEAVDAVVHLAWHGVTAGFRDDPRQITCNVRGSLNLWEIAAEAGCRSWLGLGSQAEYGLTKERLSEDAQELPVTTYGVAKLCLGRLTEQLCRGAGMRYAWVRLFSAYGPGDDERHMIPSVIRTLLDGQRPRVTAGDQLWDYLYVEDAVSALCAVLESDAGGVFNLGSGITVRLRTVIEMIRDLIGPSLAIGFGEIPYTKDQVMYLCADLRRLEVATGWKPRVTLEKGLRWTVEDAARKRLQVSGR